MAKQIGKKLYWQLLDEHYSDRHPADLQTFTYRAKVPGGWLCAIWTGTEDKQSMGGGLTFVPDEGHKWKVRTRELKSTKKIRKQKVGADLDEAG